MSTKKVSMTGKIAWLMAWKPDEYKGKQQWKVDFYPDANGQEVYNASGLENRPKDSKLFEGEKYYVFRRECEKMFKTGLTKFDPPKVTVNGELYDAEKHGLVGHGSEATVTMDVYTYDGGVGGRLDSIDITGLIVFEATDAPAKSGESEETNEAW